MLIPHSKPTIGNKEIAAVRAVLKNGFLSCGALSRTFARKFADYIGMPFGVATNSGTSALHLALLALRIKPGDEVIMPSYVCTAVLNAVNYVGAKAKIADINAEDFNINPASVETLITSKTKAIIVPHMFGVAADIGALAQYKIPIIEDCALSLGATYKKKMAGSFGAFSVFSFYATKMMTTAEGGMLLMKSKDMHEEVVDLKEYDHKDKYRLRYNYKMSDFQAVLGLAQLAGLRSFISRRQKIAKVYNKQLSDLPVKLPYPQDYKTHTYFRYVIQTGKDAEWFIKRLNRCGIEAKRPLFRPLHQYLGLAKRMYPVTEEVYRTALSLPIYPGLKENQVRFIIAKTRTLLKV